MLWSQSAWPWSHRIPTMACIFFLLEQWKLRKMLFLQKVTKPLLDVSGKKSILMGTEIGSSNFSAVSCLNKTYTCSDLSFSICEMECLRSSLPGTLALHYPARTLCILIAPSFSICLTKKWIQISNCNTRKHFHWLIKNSSTLKKKIGRKNNSAFLAAMGQDASPRQHCS